MCGLSGIAVVDLGPAIFALGGLMVIMVLADYTVDNQAVWEAIDPPNRRCRRTLDAEPRHTGPPGAARTPLAHRLRHLRAGQPNGARHAVLAVRFSPADRRPASIQRTWAFAIAAVVLYIPANIYPVLTVVQLGAGQPSTILGGVRELLDLGMWPLAALVFFASVAVPVLKLIGLAILLISTHMGAGRALHDRTVLYRMVDTIGRWSMIDIFMESILVALVQFGQSPASIPVPARSLSPRL